MAIGVPRWFPHRHNMRRHQGLGLYFQPALAEYAHITSQRLRIIGPNASEAEWARSPRYTLPVEPFGVLS